jgi:hypothetical protein
MNHIDRYKAKQDCDSGALRDERGGASIEDPALV